MKRRGFIILCAGAAAGVSVSWPLALQAQQLGKVKRIGYFSGTSAAGTQARFACFKEGLGQLGWIEGQNIASIRRAHGAQAWWLG